MPLFDSDSSASDQSRNGNRASSGSDSSAGGRRGRNSGGGSSSSSSNDNRLNGSSDEADSIRPREQRENLRLLTSDSPGPSRNRRRRLRRLLVGCSKSDNVSISLSLSASASVPTTSVDDANKNGAGSELNRTRATGLIDDGDSAEGQAKSGTAFGVTDVVAEPLSDGALRRLTSVFGDQVIPQLWSKNGDSSRLFSNRIRSNTLLSPHAVDWLWRGLPADARWSPPMEERQLLHAAIGKSTKDTIGDAVLGLHAEFVTPVASLRDDGETRAKSLPYWEAGRRHSETFLKTAVRTAGTRAEKMASQVKLVDKSIGLLPVTVDKVRDASSSVAVDVGSVLVPMLRPLLSHCTSSVALMKWGDDDSADKESGRKKASRVVVPLAPTLEAKRIRIAECLEAQRVKFIRSRKTSAHRSLMTRIRRIRDPSKTSFVASSSDVGSDSSESNRGKSHAARLQDRRSRESSPLLTSKGSRSSEFSISGASPTPNQQGGKPLAGVASLGLVPEPSLASEPRSDITGEIMAMQLAVAVLRRVASNDDELVSDVLKSILALQPLPLLSLRMFLASDGFDTSTGDSEPQLLVPYLNPSYRESSMILVQWLWDVFISKSSEHAVAENRLHAASAATALAAILSLLRAHGSMSSISWLVSRLLTCLQNGYENEVRVIYRALRESQTNIDTLLELIYDVPANFFDIAPVSYADNVFVRKLGCIGSNSFAIEWPEDVFLEIEEERYCVIANGIAVCSEIVVLCDDRGILSLDAGTRLPVATCPLSQILKQASVAGIVRASLSIGLLNLLDDSPSNQTEPVLFVAIWWEATECEPEERFKRRLISLDARTLMPVTCLAAETASRWFCTADIDGTGPAFPALCTIGEKLGVVSLGSNAERPVMRVNWYDVRDSGQHGQLEIDLECIPAADLIVESTDRDAPTPDQLRGEALRALRMVCGIPHVQGAARLLAASTLTDDCRSWIDVTYDGRALHVLWSTLGAVDPSAKRPSDNFLPDDGKSPRQVELVIALCFDNTSVRSLSSQIVRLKRGVNRARHRRRWEDPVDQAENAFISTILESPARFFAEDQGAFYRWNKFTDILDTVPLIVSKPEPKTRMHYAADRFADFLCANADSTDEAEAARLTPLAIAGAIVCGVSARIAESMTIQGERTSSNADVPFAADGRDESISALVCSCQVLLNAHDAIHAIESVNHLSRDLMFGLMLLLRVNISLRIADRQQSSALMSNKTPLVASVSSGLWDLLEQLAGFANGVNGGTASNASGFTLDCKLLSVALLLEDETSLRRNSLFIQAAVRSPSDRGYQLDQLLSEAILPFISNCCERAHNILEISLPCGLAPIVESLVHLAESQNTRVRVGARESLVAFLHVLPATESDSHSPVDEEECAAWRSLTLRLLEICAIEVESSIDSCELSADSFTLCLLPSVLVRFRSLFSSCSTIAMFSSEPLDSVASVASQVRQLASSILPAFSRLGVALPALFGRESEIFSSLHAIIVDTWACASSVLVQGPPMSDLEKRFSLSSSSSLWQNGIFDEPNTIDANSFLGQLCSASGPVSQTLNLFDKMRELELAKHELMLARMKRPGADLLDRVERMALAAILHACGAVALAENAAASIEIDCPLNSLDSEHLLEPLRPYWRAAFEIRRWFSQERQQVVQSGTASSAELFTETVSRCELILALKTRGDTDNLRRSREGLRSSVVLNKRGSKEIVQKRMRAKEWAAFFASWRHARSQSLSGDGSLIKDCMAYIQSSSLSASETVNVLRSMANRSAERQQGFRAFGNALFCASRRSENEGAIEHPLLTVATTVVVTLRSLARFAEQGQDTDAAYHYLDGLFGLGDDSTLSVAQSYAGVLRSVSEICSSRALPLSARALLLEVFNFRLRSYDVGMLSAANVFGCLASLANASLSPPSSFEPTSKSGPWISQVAWLMLRVLLLQTSSFLSSELPGGSCHAALGEVMKLICSRLATLVESFAGLLDANGAHAGDKADSIDDSSALDAEQDSLHLLRLLLCVFDGQNISSTTSDAQAWLSPLIECLISFVRHAPYRVQLLACRLLQRILLLLPSPALAEAHSDEVLLADLDDDVELARSSDSLAPSMTAVESLVDLLFELIGVAFAAASTVFARKMTVSARLSSDVLPLAAEAVELLRVILASGNQGWSRFIARRLKDSLASISSVVVAASSHTALAASTGLLGNEKKILDAVAALCVLGGNSDVLRIGAFVTGGSGGEETTKLDKDKSPPPRMPSFYSTFDWMTHTEGNVINAAAPPVSAACASCTSGSFMPAGSTKGSRSVIMDLDSRTGLATVSDAPDLVSVCQRPARSFRHCVAAHTLTVVVADSAQSLSSILAEFHDELLSLLRFFLIDLERSDAPKNVGQSAQQLASNVMLIAQLKTRAMKALCSMLSCDETLSSKISRNYDLSRALVMHALGRSSSWRIPTDFRISLGRLSLAQLESTAAAMQSVLLCEKATVSVDIVVSLQPVSSGKREHDEDSQTTAAPLSKQFSRSQDVIDGLLEVGHISASQIRAARIEFAQLDLDGNGLISADEFVESSKRRGITISDADMGRLQMLSRKNKNARLFSCTEIGEGLGFLDFIEFLFNIPVAAEQHMALADNISLGKFDVSASTANELFDSAISAAIVVRTPLSLAGAYDLTFSTQYVSQGELRAYAGLWSLKDAQSSVIRCIGSGKITVIDATLCDADTSELANRVVILTVESSGLDLDAEFLMRVRSSGCIAIIVVSLAESGVPSTGKSKENNNSRGTRKDDPGNPSANKGKDRRSRGIRKHGARKDKGSLKERGQKRKIIKFVEGIEASAPATYDPDVVCPVFGVQDSRFLDVVHYLAASPNPTGIKFFDAVATHSSEQMPLLVAAVRCQFEKDSGVPVGRIGQPGTLPWSATTFSEAVLSAANALGVATSQVSTAASAAALSPVVAAVTAAKLLAVPKQTMADRSNILARRKPTLGDSESSSLEGAFGALFGDEQSAVESDEEPSISATPMLKSSAGPRSLLSAFSRLFSRKRSTETAAEEKQVHEVSSIAKEGSSAAEQIGNVAPGVRASSHSARDRSRSLSHEATVDCSGLCSSSSSSCNSSENSDSDSNPDSSNSSTSDSDAVTDSDNSSDDSDIFGDIISHLSSKSDPECESSFLAQFAVLKKAQRADWRSRMEAALGAANSAEQWLQLKRPFYDVTEVEQRLSLLYARQACLQWLLSCGNLSESGHMAILSAAQAGQLLAIATSIPQWAPVSSSPRLVHAFTCPASFAGSERFNFIKNLDNLCSASANAELTTFTDALWWQVAGHSARLASTNELRKENTKIAKRNANIKMQIRTGKLEKPISDNVGEVDSAVFNDSLKATASLTKSSCDEKLLQSTILASLDGDMSDLPQLSVVEMILNYLAEQPFSFVSVHAFHSLMEAVRVLSGRDRLRLLRAATDILERHLSKAVQFHSETVGSVDQGAAPLNERKTGVEPAPDFSDPRTVDLTNSENSSPGCSVCRQLLAAPTTIADMIKKWVVELKESLDPNVNPSGDEERAASSRWTQDRLQFVAAYDSLIAKHRQTCFSGSAQPSDGISVDGGEAVSAEAMTLCPSLVDMDDDVAESTASKGQATLLDVRDSGKEESRANYVWRLAGRRKNEFATFVLQGIVCHTGKWYFEVALETDGRVQLGWSSTECGAGLRASNVKEHGIGDTDDSWAIDPRRACLWFAGVQTDLLSVSESQPRPRIGGAGDVWGFLLDCDQRQISFSRNGQLLDASVPLTVLRQEGGATSISTQRPIAPPYFTDVTALSGLVPAVSVSKNSHVELRASAESQQHCPAGFRPVAEAPQPRVFSPIQRYLRLRQVVRAVANGDPLPIAVKDALASAFADLESLQTPWPLAFYDRLVELAEVLGPRAFSSEHQLKSALEHTELSDTLRAWLHSDRSGGYSVCLRRFAALRLLNEDLRVCFRFINFYYDQPSQLLASALKTGTSSADLSDPLSRWPYTLLDTGSWDDKSVLCKIKNVISQDAAVAHLRLCIQGMPDHSRYYYNRIKIPISRPLAMRQQERTWTSGNELHSLLGQTYEQITMREGDKPKVWFREQPLFRVQFLSEGSEDDGGPYHELLSGIVAELHSDAVSLFVQTPNGRCNMGENRESFMPRTTATNTQQLAFLAFLGKVIGAQSVRSKTTFALQLPALVWKHIVAHENSLTIDDLRSTDVLCANSIDLLRSHEIGSDKGGGVEGLDLGGKAEADDDAKNSAHDVLSAVVSEETFCVSASDGVTRVELLSNGADVPVDHDNRNRWIELMLQYRLKHEIATQIAALRCGLSYVIPLNVVDALLTAKTMEKLVCGKSGIDFAVLKRRTRYGGGFSANHQVMRWMWQALESYSIEEQQAFLRFACGRTRLPLTWENSGLDEFSVNRFWGDARGSAPPLPQSHTCYFTIDMPMYSSYEILREKLLYACLHCGSIDTDNYNPGSSAWADAVEDE